MKTLNYFGLLIILTILSCDNETYKPNITGSMGEVMIVMSDRVKNSEGGMYIHSMFQQEMQGLPQIEKLFKVSVIPPTAFSDHLKLFRNLVVITVSPEIEQEGVKYYNTKETWAKEQALMSIDAKSLESFYELVEKYEIRILGYFMAAERERCLNFYRKNANPELIKQIEETWGFNMIIPNSYKANKPKSGKDFKWFSLETQISSEAVMVYTFDYVDESTFSKENLLFKRDSVLKENIPGSFKDSYMTTEHNFPVTYKTLTVNGHKVIELRGLWRVEGDLMGGPFILFAHHDKSNNRVVVTDGYVYFPDKPEKRNYVIKVESLLYSVKFPDS